MFLYLVQHAEAKREEEDPQRPLSEKGIKDLKKVAVHVSRLNLKITQIFHSGKVRAKQTAEVLAESLKPAHGVKEIDGLSPLDDPAIWAERLEGITAGIVLVGHLPHLEKLASLLLCGDKDKRIIAFKMGGIICLGRDDDRTWSLQWILAPDVVF